MGIVDKGALFVNKTNEFLNSMGLFLYIYTFFIDETRPLRYNYRKGFSCCFISGSESKGIILIMKRRKQIYEKIKKKRKNPYRITDLPYNADFNWGEHVPGGESR